MTGTRPGRGAGEPTDEELVRNSRVGKVPPPHARTPDRVEYRDVVYAEIDGYRPLMLDLTVPAAAPAPVPLLVWIHGGAWRRGSPRVGESWLGVADPVGAAVAAGYAVATVQYRFSGEAHYPAQRDDVRAAVATLRGLAPDVGVDPDRFGAWGESAGGHLAAVLGLDRRDAGPASRVQAVVAWYAPSDLAAFDRAPGSPEGMLLGPAARQDEAARLAGPLAHVSAQAPPTLLVHGDADPLVPCDQSRRFAAALTGAGATAELVVVPGAGHCFDGADLREPVRLSLDFFDRHL
ncbi:acetyl esterase/lipase [Streptomyces sp. KhCrAH-43]|uniref:alpha/beta hydrolase n=1 Tax=unclassified Streptomyces TaxID=2593676 RepID=UPI00036E9FCC|nr:alpha/beta hydrolase [Streptomyces sp. KhCrAH-43]MYS38795.1 alpha/beta hydrolase fold domain-containing protein [Streptomyces sp. SID4920]MYX66987.1 alpha/beta hydrolase fold domain-containing protein [Streptomyces sp. SID8373]RAJ68484.1 acetyl esterase/lipase [Streptomyces sp. KhCrAH-43]